MGTVNKKKQKKWWEEYDFEFEGIPCTYYLWPSDRTVCFGERLKDWIQIPMFDLRHVGGSIEQNIRAAIKEFDSRKKEGEKTHCHIVRYRDCLTCIGIVCATNKINPTSVFAPTNDECIERAEHRLKNPHEYPQYEDQWGMIHPARKITDKDFEDFELFKNTIKERQYLVDDLMVFESSLKAKDSKND